MKSIKGTLTEKNLLTSFAGESQARMRYTYFAKEAKREGYEQIAAVFKLTAKQEKMHAERMFRFLEGGMVEICASYPAGEIRTTMDNLRAAAAGEHEFAVAVFHGLKNGIANLFRRSQTQPFRVDLPQKKGERGLGLVGLGVDEEDLVQVKGNPHLLVCCFHVYQAP